MTTNEIPHMDDPMGKHWEQPHRSRILIDDKHALMTEVDFNKLHDYSTSTPSGVYPGKMWRCYQRGKWWLRWFGLSDDPKFCSNHAREILPTI